MSTLHTITFPQWQLESGKTLTDVPLTYQVFGPEVGTAPVVVVNHALTGNSNVAGNGGWWGEIIGDGKVVDTRYFTVLAFNIPGNGHGNNYFIDSYKAVSVSDVAALFWRGLDLLDIGNVFAIIGGSLGGGVAWHMAAYEPERLQHLIPVATHHKATDWVIANVLVQDRILSNSSNPVADARLHAMLLYRTPQSLQERFEGQETKGGFAIEHWLNNHGRKLQERFTLPAYLLMNHLLKTIDVDVQALIKIQAAIHLVAVDTDLLFTAHETYKTFRLLKDSGMEIAYNHIVSIHGHDAFLIENDQLNAALKPVFALGLHPQLAG